MTEKISFARGTKRMTKISSFPCFDSGSEIKYFGSISKCGDNADWDWGTKQNQNGEWILAEADGPGCIFNFTQHRYPTSKVPTFRFYFDNSDVPQFEITPAEFGKKAPFLSPLADIFVGPEDNGRGPIWVVRSFVPMEFTSHCKVTSTVKLEGADKALGQGGWGHILLHLYDNAEGLETFSPEKDFSELTDIYAKPLSLPFTEKNISELSLAPHKTEQIAKFSGNNTIVGISVTAKDFSPEFLANLYIRLIFDGKETVSAPFGTFFGCEYGKTKANLETSLLTCDISCKTAHFENRFPMPFFENATILLENRGDFTIYFPEIVIKENKNLTYNKETTGIFTASEYYPKTENTPNKNSLIADIKGRGQMVYGVITGEDIECGCEGDVRIFIDGLSSPSVESDGSESWGSYGWGFVCPPQCNPFSAYNGVPDSNNTWSELRLTHTDCYPFKSNLRFELEHGCQNDGGGFHSGQIFCYMSEKAAEKHIITLTPESEEYNTDGTISEINDRFENGIHENYSTYKLCKDMTYSRFKVKIPENNNGVVIKRVSSQKEGFMKTNVFIDGERVDLRSWLYQDYNDCYCLLSDSFIVPQKYTYLKSEIEIKIVPCTDSWNECEYKIFVIM